MVQTAQVSSALYHSPKGFTTLGEGPFYRASDSTLHWFDCLATPCELYILPVDPDTGAPRGEARVLPLADSVTVAGFRKDKPGSYIAAYYQGVCTVDEETGRIDVVREIIPTDQRDNLRFNDGGVDAGGRFWLAEMDLQAMKYGLDGVPESYGTPKGRLWRYDPDGSLHCMIDGGITCGNGVTWSPDNKTMYVNDSAALHVYAYDFDLETGGISNRRILVDERQWSGGAPDGMVADTQGNLWIAVYATRRVMVFRPDGTHLRDVEFPARDVTCTTWGGKDHNILYVTSGTNHSGTHPSGEEGGPVYMFRPGDARGQAKYEFGA
ncbi:SMP-30/gluconolactonase/LRE family protein [Aspergillus candidus]|uniref:SGL-domain-containing protein n=1 Tax=Aspergillus candidus TaxID=41067 RepID=A0A2I2FP32_ASPCN|nr:SGL-domain-containing protein [Aspergillus candidus]PLB42383.1 SGL-domain-containing protein [Aspergillus candidus]